VGPVQALSADLANQPAAADGRRTGQSGARDYLADQSVISEVPVTRFVRRAESTPEQERGRGPALPERPTFGPEPAESGRDQVKGTEEHEPSSSECGSGCAASARPDGAAPPELGILACRIAGSLVHHEPGWRMPRFSVLARHFGVSQEQVAEAVEQLANRRLVRRRPDGYFGRLTPAEYHIPLSARACLRTAVVPVSGALTCRARAVGTQWLRDDVAWVLGATAGEAGCVLKLQYALDDEPAALSMTYMTAAFRPLLDKLAAEQSPELLPLGVGDPAADCRGRQSVQLEMQQPSTGVASLIHLAPGEKAIVISARVDDRAAGGPAALTVAILRPDRFRITIGSADTPLAAWRDDDDAERGTAIPGAL
jgi:DNA-binding GntR family transcriptional regulator